MYSFTEENYLKAIYKLSERESEKITTNSIAQMLETKAASVTDMIKKLSDKKLLKYEKYKGVTLTEKGRLIAVETVRKHRLWEVFLFEKLQFGWEEVHDIAEQLEHIHSELLTNKLDDFLGNPTHDPHGSPIPTKDGRVEDVDFPSLSDLAVGQRAMIRRVDGRNPDKLRYLGELGLYPDTPVQLLEREPFGGPLRLLVKGKKRAIGPELARHVFVAVQEGSAKESSSS